MNLIFLGRFSLMNDLDLRPVHVNLLFWFLHGTKPLKS